MEKHDDCQRKTHCFFPGSGCDGAGEQVCPFASEMKKMKETPCPIYKVDGCDIPLYRILATDACACGKDEECRIKKVLRGMIPPQDFEDYDGAFPALYLQPRHTIAELKQALRKNGI